MLRRERLAGLRVGAYVLPRRCWSWSLLVAVQSAALMAVVGSYVRLPANGLLLEGPLELGVTTALTSLAGRTHGSGLCISAWAKTPDRAISIVPLALIPQILFSGVLFPFGSGTSVTRVLSWLTVSRWAMDAYGSTVNLGRLPPRGPRGQYAHTQAHLFQTWQNPRRIRGGRLPARVRPARDARRRRAVTDDHRDRSRTAALRRLLAQARSGRAGLPPLAPLPPARRGLPARRHRRRPWPGSARSSTSRPARPSSSSRVVGCAWASRSTMSSTPSAHAATRLVAARVVEELARRASATLTPAHLVSIPRPVRRGPGSRARRGAPGDRGIALAGGGGAQSGSRARDMRRAGARARARGGHDLDEPLGPPRDARERLRRRRAPPRVQRLRGRVARGLRTEKRPPTAPAWGDGRRASSVSGTRAGRTTTRGADRAPRSVPRSRGAADMGLRRAVIDIPGAPPPEGPARRPRPITPRRAGRASEATMQGARSRAINALQGFAEHPIGGLAELVADLTAALPEDGRAPRGRRALDRAGARAGDPPRSRRATRRSTRGPRTEARHHDRRRAPGEKRAAATDRVLAGGSSPWGKARPSRSPSGRAEPPRRGVFLDGVAARADPRALGAPSPLLSKPWDRVRWLGRDASHGPAPSMRWWQSRGRTATDLVGAPRRVCLRAPAPRAGIDARHERYRRRRRCSPGSVPSSGS